MTEASLTATNPLACFLGYNLRRSSALQMSALARSLSRLDLKVAEASVLVVIGANTGITQIEVGRLLGIARANLAPLVAALIARKLVQRRAVDGRSQALALTRSGRTVSERAIRHMRGQDAALTECLTVKERTTLFELLCRIAEEGRSSGEPRRPPQRKPGA